MKVVLFPLGDVTFTKLRVDERMPVDGRSGFLLLLKGKVNSGIRAPDFQALLVPVWERFLN